MKRNFFKLFAVLLTAAMVLGIMTGCGGTKKSKKDLEKVEYTYRDVWSTGPLNWNPHAWEVSSDSQFMNYLTTPIADSTVDKPGEWKWEFDAANDVKDITASFANM